MRGLEGAAVHAGWRRATLPRPAAEPDQDGGRGHGQGQDAGRLLLTLSLPVLASVRVAEILGGILALNKIPHTAPMSIQITNSTPQYALHD